MLVYVWIIIALIIAYIILCVVFSTIVFNILLYRPKFSIKDTPMTKEERSKFIQRYEDGIDWLDTVKYEKVFIYNKKIKLCGIYIKNKNSNKTVIIVHGYAAKKEYRIMDAPFYYKQGFNILLIDNRAHGESDGEYLTMGIKESEDLALWCEWASNKKSNCKILLDGVSMGAATVLNTSALNLPKNVKGIVADCGYTTTLDVVRSLFKQYHIPVLSVMLIGEILARMHGFSLKIKNPIDNVKKAKLPALFIHGESDNLVPTHMVDELFKNYAGEKTLVKTPDVGHALSFTMQTKMCENAVKKFVEKYF